MSPAPEALRALARKYRVMGALRAQGASDETAEERANLRQIAAEFPGALRELDTLPTEEIAARERALEAAAADLLLDALVTRFTEGYAASVAPLSRALRAFGEPDGGGEDRRWLWLACRLAQDLWDDELWHVLATRGVRVARETGALTPAPELRSTTSPRSTCTPGRSPPPRR